MPERKLKATMVVNTAEQRHISCVTLFFRCFWTTTVGDRGSCGILFPLFIKITSKDRQFLFVWKTIKNYVCNWKRIFCMNHRINVRKYLMSWTVRARKGKLKMRKKIQQTHMAIYDCWSTALTRNNLFKRVSNVHFSWCRRRLFFIVFRFAQIPLRSILNAVYNQQHSYIQWSAVISVACAQNKFANKTKKNNSLQQLVLCGKAFYFISMFKRVFVVFNFV